MDKTLEALRQESFRLLQHRLADQETMTDNLAWLVLKIQRSNDRVEQGEIFARLCQWARMQLDRNLKETRDCDP